MATETQLKRHAGLVDDMAAVRGLDLEEQMMRGKLSIPDLDDAVLRCTGCLHPESCAQWLATRDGIESESPSYCRNADVFAELLRGG